ncbi:MAG: outer membrane beta-barrel protein [Sulfurospirillum sp.]|nr:outer membrane beta-barrel protein [Sulfurospirillum sp.]
MKKIAISSLLAFVMSVSLNANNSGGWFIGGELGMMSVGVYEERAPENAILKDEDSYDAFNAAIKFGKYGNNSRVYGFYENQGEEDSSFDNSTANTFGVGYDYLFINSTKIVPFVGVQAMYMSVNIDGSNLAPSGPGLGVGFGFIYPITNNIEIEAGYRVVSLGVIDSAEWMPEICEHPNEHKVGLKDYTQSYIGLNYKF